MKPFSSQGAEMKRMLLIALLMLVLPAANAKRKLTPCEVERVAMDQLLQANSQQISLRDEIIETQKRIISDLQSANYMLKLAAKEKK